MCVPDRVVANDGLGLLGVDDMAVVVKVHDDVVACKWRQSLGERDLLWTGTRDGGWRFMSHVPVWRGQPNWGSWGPARPPRGSVEMWGEDGDVLATWVAPTPPWLGARTSHPCPHPRLCVGWGSQRWQQPAGQKAMWCFFFTINRCILSIWGPWWRYLEPSCAACPHFV